jgi:hypothetical protein
MDPRSARYAESSVSKAPGDGPSGEAKADPVPRNATAASTMIIRFKVVRIFSVPPFCFVLMRRLTGDFVFGGDRLARQCHLNFQG